MKTCWKVGTYLPNGALILALKPSSVEGWSVALCLYNREHVVWNVNDESGACQSGSYYGRYDVKQSTAEYNQRS